MTTERWEPLRRSARRAQSWVLCGMGRHMYAQRRNPEVSGAGAVFWECRRCRYERTEYGKPPSAGGRGPWGVGMG